MGAIATAIAVAGATSFVVWQLHPLAYLFRNSLDDGGDNPGHVAAAWYLIHGLLPHGRISGWFPGWLDGMPLYVFYFPLPALFVAVLSSVMPFAVAFKVVTASGPVLLPIAAYFFGRLAGYQRPTPALMAVATLPFLFTTSYSVYGGNLASVMTGEYSFSLALVFGLLFLGFVVRGLEKGGCRAAAAVALAATVLCHMVPALFFGAAAVIIVLSYRDRRRLATYALVGITGGLLASFWIVPFAADSRYTSSLNYGSLPNTGKLLFPLGTLWLILLGLLGGLAAFALRDRLGMVMAVMLAGSGIAVAFGPGGLISNGRWLPFWFLSAALLSAHLMGESGRIIAMQYRFERWLPVSPLAAVALVLVVVGVPLNTFGFTGVTTMASSPLGGWIRWTYTGYQQRLGWQTYQEVVALLDKAGATYGCGRVVYEYSPVYGEYFGSTHGFMALPMFTNGCIGTSDGLYFESSTTTPFQFLDGSELASQPLHADKGLPYGKLDVADGIRHCQLLGVDYFLAFTPAVERQAAADPDLVLLGRAQRAIPGGDFELFKIRRSPLVVALSHSPVVEAAMTPAGWQALAIRWFQNESDWSVPVVTTGPTRWSRVPAGSLVAPGDAQVLPPVSVSHVGTTSDSVSFDVSRTGVPVLVKVPYFPNWHASGAEGPFEATPNQMVVVPTSRHVVLDYGHTTADWLGLAGSILGVGLAALLGVGLPGRRRRAELRAHPDGPALAGEPVQVEQDQHRVLADATPQGQRASPP